MAGRVAAMPAFGSDGLAMLGRCIEPTLGRWKLGICTFGRCMFGRCMFGMDGLACGIWGLACGMLGRAWGRACGMDGLACGICGRAAACPWFPPPPARPTEGRATAWPASDTRITREANAAASRMA
jgi:hypothetical protein